MNNQFLESGSELRPDLRIISTMITRESKVLDLGCGDGELLAHLISTKKVIGRGIELSEDGVLACVRRGLSIRQGNLQEGLADYPDRSFDFIILSQTLRYLDDPAMILREMLRVGHLAIVSFANWGYWRSRLKLLLWGIIPEASDQPQPWYEPPRWQPFTVTDFKIFCRQNRFQIREEVYLSGQNQGHILSNFMAKTAVFILAEV
jgi:methionine biosynthesis protein MetW